MLPRQHRLHLSADLRRVNRKGRRFVVSNAVFSVLLLPKQTRIGVITPGKIGNSVIRHKVARKIRAAAAQFVQANPEGYEIVVRAQPGSELLEVSGWLELFDRCKP